MTEYTTKRKVFEAHRFDVEHAQELAKWCNGTAIPSPRYGWLISLGAHTAVPGDYIFRRAYGIYGTMTADQFEDQFEVIGGTQDRDYLLARLLASTETAPAPEIRLPKSAFAEGYYVELGEHRFSQSQWEVIQLYASGVARVAVEQEAGHKAQRQNREFHDVMGIETATSPRAIPVEDVPVVIELIREEFEDELIPALQEGNVVEIYDAALDILYVTYGLLNRAGMDAEPGYDEVQASNMSKLGADGKPIIAQKNDPDGTFPGRVKKGPNYFKPNLARVLRDQGWQG